MMTSDNDGLLRLNNTALKPVENSTLDRFAVQYPMRNPQIGEFRSEPPSTRSISPTDRVAFVGNLSPHSSITTGRHAGDSSIDTSTDSISNSASTMSAVPSQASSISDDLLSLSSGGKRIAKGKTRLRNIDRKAICEAAQNNPKMRQEELAARFGIERSTVSKTLKNKEKWLAIEDNSDGAMIVKHRIGKFPKVEEKLAQWLRDNIGVNDPIADITIKNQGLEIAKELGYGVDEFKASVGWIEKFRERYGIKKPVSSENVDSVANKRLFTFKSNGPLTINQVDQVEQLRQREGTNQEAAMFYSRTEEGPPRASTPQTSHSFADDPALAIHETPKASKRHYDDMSQTGRLPSSIDTDMARMHLPQGSFLEHEQSDALLGPSHDDSGVAFRSATSRAPQKRRKGRNGESDHNISTRAQTHGQNAAAMLAIRDHLRRTRDGELSNGQQPTFQLIAAAVAAAQAIRRNEDTRSMQQTFHRRHQSQPETVQRQSPDSMMVSSNNAHGIHRTVSHPVDHENFQSPNTRRISALEAESPNYNGIITGLDQTLPDDQVSAESEGDRRVSLEEARESLDIVLSFITRQPANLSPNDYFVLGNLQGILSSLASQGQLPSSNGLDTSDSPSGRSPRTPQGNDPDVLNMPGNEASLCSMPTHDHITQP